MRHIIDAIAAQGRGDDTELLHVTKGEMRGLDALAKRHFGRELPRNPRTGLKEASLFQDWFGSDVGQVLDVAAPVAVGFIPGVGVPAAVAMGAATGAANQGLGKNGTTESALMGGVMGGIGAYGGSGLAEGLGAGATATAPAGVATPTSQAGASLGSGTISDAGANLAMGNTTTAGAYGPAAGSDMAGAGGTNLFQGTPNATTPSVMPNSAANTFQPGTTPVQTGIASASNPPANIPNAPLTSQSTTTVDKPLNWDYLKTKDALGPATSIGTSALGTAQLPSGEQNTDSGIPSVNKSLPKSEVYYTPYGERRTRIVAAEGGIMGFNGQYGDYDGAEDGDGARRYNNGGGIGFIRSMQPGGAWGDATADLYGVVDKNAPWLNQMQPGGFMGATVPGKMDYEDKKRAEEQAKIDEQKATAAAAAKAQQEQDFNAKWQDRYANAMSGQPYAMGGIAGMGMRPGAGISNVGYARGKYLQGPGDGMSDSIPASIDGKQEARLATGEFVVPADVVSHLGNGDSSAGAKQLHSMMDRARMARTGTKQQGKQINPRKVMPV